MKIKYQIFISSTYEDLKEVREQIIKCILEMGHIPVGMEMFSAGNDEQWKIIQKQIDDCDYYVVIVAHRYGSLDKEISYTEKEYDYAISKNIPVLGFLIDETTKWSSSFIDSDEITKQKLIMFKEKIKTKMINYWKSTEDLYGKAAIALSKAFTSYERPGYIRSDEVANKDVYNELTRLSTENAKLRKTINEIEESQEIDLDKKESQLLNILESNKRNIPIKFTDDEINWNKDFNLSLLEIFEAISERLLIESEELILKQAIALKASGRTDYHKQKTPVANNRFYEWMADLHSLDLIEPSKKSHSIADNSKYWTLSALGRDIFGKLRRLKLIAGIVQENNLKEDEENSSSETE